MDLYHRVLGAECNVDRGTHSQCPESVSSGVQRPARRPRQGDRIPKKLRGGPLPAVRDGQLRAAARPELPGGRDAVRTASNMVRQDWLDIVPL